MFLANSVFDAVYQWSITAVIYCALVNVIRQHLVWNQGWLFKHAVEDYFRGHSTLEALKEPVQDDTSHQCRRQIHLIGQLQQDGGSGMCLGFTQIPLVVAFNSIWCMVS